MEKAYLHYTVDDFIVDEDFQRWVNFPDKQSNAFWKKWIEDHPWKRDDVMKASAFISHLRFHTTAPGYRQVETALNKNLRFIETRERTPDREQPVKRRKKVVLTTLFVSAALLVVTLWQALQQTPLITEVRTGRDEVKTVKLPDGSVIIMNANSSVKYGSDLAEKDKREIWLQGEAFFDIKQLSTGKNGRQFIVHSDYLHVEVLGTKFNVRKRADIYNVSLNSGNLKIKLGNGEGSVIYMKPGDFLQYAAKEKSILKKKVKAALYSQWTEQKLVLDNVPFTAVAEMIKDIYGYHTIIRDKKLLDDNISATILMKDETTFLQDLSTVLNISIKKKENEIIFIKNKTR